MIASNENRTQKQKKKAAANQNRFSIADIHNTTPKKETVTKNICYIRRKTKYPSL